MAQTLWYFELLGRFRAESHARSFDRFRTQKTASLLAYLLLHADRPHTREALIDQFWPESTFEAGQTNLRVALNSLRKQLEPPGTPVNALLIATRDTVQIVAEAIETDVAQFQAAIRRFQSASDIRDQMEHGAEAIRLYKGRLLPALYDDWVLREQQHLESLSLNILRKMSLLCTRTGDVGTALEFALRAVECDPLNEELHAEVLRLYLAAEQPSAAVRHFQQFAALLSDQFDGVPSPETQALVAPWFGSRELLSRPTAGTVKEPLSPVSPLATPEPPPVRLSPALPPLLGTLRGRDEEREFLLAKLRTEGPLLLTLTGPGGVGKTRLATELTHLVSEQFGDRIAFVSLAEFTDPDMIPFAILQAFQLRASKQREPIQALVEHLGDAPALLALDNFEQLVPSGLDEIRALRDHLPNLKLLITSRHVLGLGGEQTFAVLPFPSPTASRLRTLPSAGRALPEPDIAKLLQNAGVQLFLERAQALRPDFQITPRNASDLAAVCAHLEGMPLAIELAASWINVLSPAQLLERFRYPSRTLSGRRRDISPRHRTVQNTVAWSYQLLSPALQQALCLLSTFRGGWTLEALDAISNPQDSDPASGFEDLIDVLAELQERSLIFSREEKAGDDTRLRYRMLESVREFCDDQLSLEDREAHRQRHAEYFFEYAEQAKGDYNTERQEHAVVRLFADYENALAAMEWFLNGSCPASPPRGLQMTTAIYGMWTLLGMQLEAMHYMERALAHPCNQGSIAPRAAALNMIASLYSESGDNEKALALLYEALAIRQQLGNESGMGASMNTIGIVLQAQGRFDEALEAYGQAVALFRKGSRPTHIAIGLRNMAIICDLQKRHEQADIHLTESLEICRREKYAHGTYSALNTLANRDYVSGRHTLARERYEECVSFFRESQDLGRLASNLSSLGRLYYDLGETKQSRAALSEAITLNQRMDDKQEITLVFEHIAYTHQESAPHRAAISAGVAQSLRDLTGSPKPPSDVPAYTRLLDSLRQRLGDQTYRAAFDAGYRMELNAAVDFALETLRLS